MQNSSQGAGATARRRSGAIARRPPPKPRGGPSALAGERSEPIWLGVRDHTHALFALKVQRKLSNGEIGRASRRERGEISGVAGSLKKKRSGRGRQVCANTSAQHPSGG